MENENPTLFHDLPAYGRARTADERWRRIAYKLNVFHQHGGEFRDKTVEEFETEYDYPNFPNVMNNCYFSAIGFLTTGDRGLTPGHIALLPMDGQDIVCYDNTDHVLQDMSDVMYDAEQFENRLQDGLKADKIVKDIRPDQVGDYYAMVGFSYDHLYGRCDDDYDMDYHFLVPHLKQNETGNVSFAFSARSGRAGDYRFFENEQDMVKAELDDSCNRVDVYFVPKSYLGQKVEITDAEAAQKRQKLEEAAAHRHAFIGAVLSVVHGHMRQLGPE